MKPLALWRRLWDRVPDDPLYQPRAPLWRPALMTHPPPLPLLSPLPGSARIEKRFALLINPFYPKDPHGSFGKHVLTPSLALTSVAASTPAGWRVGYWDENLLQGGSPGEPVPEVVGITVHLTFAERAYALATAYRRLGARVILGGLHVQTCPDEAARYADAIAIGDGVALWPQMLDDIAPGSIWRRRPRDRAFVLPYLAAALLYKRANWLWPWLIRHQSVRAVWRPFLECSRRFRRPWRRRLAAGLPCQDTDKAVAGRPIVPAGV